MDEADQHLTQKLTCLEILVLRRLHCTAGPRCDVIEAAGHGHLLQVCLELPGFRILFCLHIKK